MVYSSCRIKFYVGLAGRGRENERDGTIDECTDMLVGRLSGKDEEDVLTYFRQGGKDEDVDVFKIARRMNMCCIKRRS